MAELERGLLKLVERGRIARWLVGLALVLVGVAGSEIRALVMDPGGELPDLTSQVVEIVDGDTVVVEYHGPAVEREIVRLLNIDTPERGERYFAEASDALAGLVGDGRVRLEFERGDKPTRGVYGRMLAYLFVEELNVNVELVRLGWSEYYTKYGRSRYDKAFLEAEAEARTEGRGLWATRVTERSR